MNIHSAPYAYLPKENLIMLLAMFLTVGAIYGIVYLALKIAVGTFEVFAHAVERGQEDLCSCERWDCDKKH